LAFAVDRVAQDVHLDGLAARLDRENALMLGTLQLGMIR
jgi:hypothetical protein